MSLQRAVSLLLSHTHHFHSVSEVKTKPHHGTDDSDLVFFDIRLDSVTLTEPGLAVFAGFVLNVYFCRHNAVYMCEVAAFALKYLICTKRT